MTLTPVQRQDLYSEDGEQAVIYLLTFESEDWSEPLRICDDNDDITADGRTFETWPMQVRLPDELEDEDRAVQITVSSVQRDIVDKLREQPEEVEVTLEIVMSGDPDQIPAGPFEMSLGDVNYNVLDISGDLTFADLVNDTYPEPTFTPQTAPGLFST